MLRGLYGNICGDNNHEQSYNDNDNERFNDRYNEGRLHMSTHEDSPLGKLSPTVSMESFISGVSTATDVTNTTYASDMCDESLPIRIQTYIKYNMKDWLLTVGVKQAECPLQSKHVDRKVYWQVHMTLLPHRIERRKTKYKSTQTPVFNQLFDIGEVPRAALSQMAVRYRLYGRFKRIGRKKLVGEVEVPLGEIVYKRNNIIDGEWWTLKSKIQLNRRMSSRASLSYI